MLGYLPVEPTTEQLKQAYTDNLAFIPVFIWMLRMPFTILAPMIFVLSLLIAIARNTRSPALFPLRAFAVVYTDVFRGGGTEEEPDGERDADRREDGEEQRVADVARHATRRGAPLRDRRDADRDVLPGNGILPLREGIEAVRATGYDDLWCVEMLGAYHWEWDPYLLARELYQRAVGLLWG